jgi:hypothetical protein
MSVCRKSPDPHAWLGAARSRARVTLCRRSWPALLCTPNHSDVTGWQTGARRTHPGANAVEAGDHEALVAATRCALAQVSRLLMPVVLAAVRR